MLQNNLDFAESAIPEKSDVVDYIDDISFLARIYFDNRRLFLNEDKRRVIQTYFNSLGILDSFWPRAGDFDPFPEKWYEYSNILKRDNKRNAIANFIPYLIAFFLGIKKPLSNILPFKTIRDIGMLDNNSPFDKLLAEISKVVGARKGSPSSNVEDVSLYSLIFLFRLLNASSNRKDIDEVLECNNALLQDSDTMEELFYLLNSLQEDSDFLLHFVNDIDFLQQCGLHKGEYDCYGCDQLVYEDTKGGEWNGFFFNNLKKVKIFNFNNVPVFTDKRKYSILTHINLLHWFFLILSKMMGEPGILEFVDRWQIDNHLMLILLFVLGPYASTILTILPIYLFFYIIYLRVFIWNIINFVSIHILGHKYNSIFLYIFEIIPLLINALPYFKLIIENFAQIITSMAVFIIYFILLLWCAFVVKIYVKRLSNILFVKDILRIRRYVRNIRDFYLKIRDKNEKIKSLFIKYLPQCSSFFDVDIKENKSLNDEQKELFNLIFTDGEISAGDLPRFYYLFYKYLEMFAKIIVEIQYVGSYVNAAMLVYSGKFCIPKFRYSGDNYIKMQDVVHPYLIDGGVRNSFELGEKETGIRNMIFSGSNGTGKTTFQFAVVDNVILAQSLGIACCSEYSATPFDKIISMSNARTDLSEGLSGYTSEVEMVKDCLSYLSQNKDKRILLISDEPLSTTDPDFADWIVERIFRCVFSYPNVMSVVATHFKSPKKISDRDKYLHAGNFRFKIEEKGTSLENLHLLERGQGDNLGKIIAKQRGLLDLIDINE